MAKAIIDTNVVLGYLVRGDSLFKTVLEKYSEIVLPNQVFFETAFTLESYYKVKRLEIVNMLLVLLQTKKLSSDKILLINTLYLYRDKPKLSLVDCFLIILAKELKSDLISNDKEIVKAIHPRVDS